MRYATQSSTSSPWSRSPPSSPRGAKEPIVPMAWAQAATRLLPRGELAIVPGSPHNANYSAANHLADLVLVFLRKELRSRGVRD
jgi:pimeloyl-ACP methyl ester carboxylesterase